MTRFGALVFLLLCLNISGSQAQQCQEFKDGFKNYFQCILNCYRTHFGSRFKAGDLCTSEVTIEDASESESEDGYRADQVELSLDCIAHQCMSEIPPSVCEDSSTTTDSVVSTPASTSEGDSTPSITSTSFTASSGPTVSTGLPASSYSGVSNSENQLDYGVDCEESTDVETVSDNNASSVSTTDNPTGSTDYSYEYYSDEDYAEANATSSSSTANGKSEGNADATSASGGAASASATAQYQNNESEQPQNGYAQPPINGNVQPKNNGNTQPQNNGNTQSQNIDKKGVDSNIQNSNNGNGYSYYGNNPQSFAVAATGNNYRQPNQQVPVSNLQYQNFGNQRSNQNQYYYQRPVVQPAYNQPPVTKQNSALQVPANNYSSNSEANASSSAGNGKTVANADATSANGGSARASSSTQYQNNGNAQLQNNGNAQLQNNDRQGANTKFQNSNNGNGYSYYGNIPQSVAVAGNDNNGRQINQQVPASNLQYQKFGNQRNNQNQYYYQMPAIQPVYNQPQVINQNTAFQPPVGGNNLNSPQAMYSSYGNQAFSSNNALDSGYVYNNRLGSATSNAVGNSGGNLNSYNSGFRQNYGTGGNDGLGSAASANSRSAANGGEAEASAAAFSSMSNSMSNPSSENNGGPLRFNFGDDTLLIHGNQVQWHRNNQLMDSFPMN